MIRPDPTASYPRKLRSSVHRAGAGKKACSLSAVEKLRISPRSGLHSPLVPMLQCKACLDLHGPGCAATHETDAGDPCCVFCLDGVPCPVQRKRLRCGTDQKAPTTETPAENTSANLIGSSTAIEFVNRARVRSSNSDREQESGVKMQKTPETDAIIAPKTCKRPGCETQLGPKNRIGLCPRHVRWTGTSKERPSNGDGHAAAGSNGHHEAGNGSPAKANGHAHTVPREASSPENGAAAVLPALAADRVDHLIANLTAADKAKIAFAWLKGEL
jgi:hypothetical protein